MPSLSSSSSSSSSSRDQPPAPELITRYEQLMTSILGTDLHALVHKANEEEPIPSRPISKAEKQNAKKKRRKARDRETHAEGLIVPDDDHIDQVEFRLFSLHPMQRVSLAPSNQDYLLTPNPRLVAPTPSQVHLLRCRAEQAAVTWPDLGAPPSQAICPTRARRVESLRCTQATALPTIFFGVTSEETHVGYPGTSIPVLSVLPLESEGMVKRQRRRWRTKSLREWAQPQYWQPPPGLEGRSRGYAYGYG